MLRNLILHFLQGSGLLPWSTWVLVLGGKNVSPEVAVKPAREGQVNNGIEVWNWISAQASGICFFFLPISKLIKKVLESEIGLR